MTNGFPYVWRVRSRLPERFGQRCAVLARGRMNSQLVRFEDGTEVITSRNYTRRAPSGAASLSDPSELGERSTTE